MRPRSSSVVLLSTPSLAALHAVAAWLLLLLLLACSCSPAAAQPNTASTVNVSSSQELLAALQSPGPGDTVIVLVGDVSLGPDFASFEAAPLRVTRNITITGPAGRAASSVDSMPVIDLEHKPGIIELCSTCHFVFAWVNIAHENLVGTGLGMSTFQGKPGSRLERVGGVGIRTACPATTPTLKLLNSTARTPLFPSPPGGQQLAGTTDFVFRGKQYRDMLSIGDLSSHIPMQQVTNTAFAGGYAIRRRNATRLCDNIVSAQCLQQKLPEQCIADILSATASSSSNSQRTVAIAVSVAVGGLLLLTALGAVLWRRARKRRQAPGTAAAAAAAAGLKPEGAPSAADASDVGLAGDQGTQQSGMSAAASQPQQTGSTVIIHQQHSSGASGPGVGGPWLMVWSSSAPNMLGINQAAADTIELGVLVGAGSFGKVYRSRWAGLEVAVKVIQHTSRSAKEVATEVQLMLALNHPNLVRAYHCVTKQLVSQEQQQQEKLQHYNHQAAAASTATSSSPRSRGSNSSTAGRPSQQQQQPASAAADSPLQLPPVPSTPKTSAAAGGALRAGSTTTCSSSIVSSSLGRHVQDLDPAAPPAHQRRSWLATQQQQQQLALLGASSTAGAAASPSAGSNAAAAASAAAAAACDSPTAGGSSSRQLTISSSAAAAAASGSQASCSSSHAGHSPAAWPVIAGALGGAAGAGAGVGGSGGSGDADDDEAAEGQGVSGSNSLLGGVLCETYLVLEYCNRGTLATQASELQPQSNEQHMLCLLGLLRDVACGLLHLKNHNVVHADLNAHNMLVASSPVAAHGLVAKVADMGLSRVLKQHATHRTTRTVGMLTHQPPELLQHGRMSPAVDIYSFGIMMHEVFTRQVAFGRLRYGQIFQQVVLQGARPPVAPDSMPEDYELLMRSCWSAAPGQRPSADMLLECLDLMIQDRQQQQQE